MLLSHLVYWLEVGIEMPASGRALYDLLRDLHKDAL